MRKALKGLLSWSAAGFWWLLDRLYGDAFFKKVQPMIPDWAASLSLDKVLSWVFSFGPPITLFVFGAYFFLSGRKEIKSIDSVHAQPVPDLPVVEAFNTALSQSKWAKELAESPERMPEGIYENSMDSDAERIAGRLRRQLNKAIHDALRLNQLTAWGRPRTGAPREPIAPEKWSEIFLDFDQNFIRVQSQPFIGALYFPHAKRDGSSLAYFDVMFSRSQFFTTFPLLDAPFVLPRASTVSRVPFVKFRRMVASAYKWDVSGKTNSEILDLLDGLRQAGVDREIRFWGKRNPSGASKATVDEPLILIPADHWHDFQIEFGTAINANENAEIATYNFKRGGNVLRGGYLDIHIHEPEAVQWMNSSAEKYRGRRGTERK